tara:strand:+ start:15189 stop:15740 length:552 start_codon:yes stop_codon:yes gene_type:complete
MSYILYYSRYCNNCQEVLNALKNQQLKEKIHYLPVDKREVRDGKTCIILQSGEAVALPPTITKVPALLLLERGCACIYGGGIIDHLIPNRLNTREVAQSESAPDSFSFSGTFGGVASDSFSFLDQSSQDLEAKGNGGMRQPHHYAALDSKIAIRTPPDTWTPDKVTEGSIQKLEEERNRDARK